MLIYLGIRTCCNGVVLVTGRDGSLAGFGLLAAHSDPTNHLQSFLFQSCFIAGLRQVQATNHSSLYVFRILQQIVQLAAE